MELPGNMDYSELHVYSPNADQAYSLPRTVAWMNGERDAHMSLFRIGLSPFQPPVSTTGTLTLRHIRMISLTVLSCSHTLFWPPPRHSLPRDNLPPPAFLSQWH